MVKCGYSVDIVECGYSFDMVGCGYPVDMFELINPDDPIVESKDYSNYTVFGLRWPAVVRMSLSTI